jgi:hypothetical protein
MIADGARGDSDNPGVGVNHADQQVVGPVEPPDHQSELPPPTPHNGLGGIGRRSMRDHTQHRAVNNSSRTIKS